jgi:Na+/melibiose symporter-like transporter
MERKKIRDDLKGLILCNPWLVWMDRTCFSLILVQYVNGVLMFAATNCLNQAIHNPSLRVSLREFDEL